MSTWSIVGDKFMRNIMNKKRMIRIALIAVGLFLVVFGVNKGDYYDIMNKAIRICYECIGIG